MATTAAHVLTDQDQAKEPEHRSAILFIGGLGESGADQSADGIASRIAHALDRNAAERRAEYTVLAGANEVTLSEDLTVARATVQRSAPDGSTAALDVWRLATAEELTEDYEQAKLHVKLLRGARVVLRYGRKAQIVFRNGTPAKNALDRAQLWVVRAMIALIGLYLVGLLVAVLGEVAAMDWVPGWVSAVVLGLTGLGIWQSALVKRLTSSAVQLHCLLDYISEGDSVSEFRAHVADTLEYLGTQEDIVYDQIDVIAYSFGTVVALDAVFPRADVPGPGFDGIGTMVTIGCPYDLLTTYWPSYYTERHQSAGVPARWVNIYSPRDVFGSNFLANDETELGIAMQGGAPAVRPESSDWVVVPEDAEAVKLWQILGFPGLKAHGLYWDATSDQHESVYSPIVRRLYADKALLA